jgi:serine/threonine protein phosphatase PrpC
MLKSTLGWRTNMEDAHIADDKVVDKVAVFGVFDGHGGNKYNIYIIFTII